MENNKNNFDDQQPDVQFEEDVIRCKSIPSPLLSILAEASMSGHTYLNIEDAISRYVSQHSRCSRGDFEAEMDALAEKHKIVLENGRIYRRQDWDHENAIAENLAQLPVNCVDIKKSIEAAIDAAETFTDLTLDESQRAAVITCFENPITILSGGAGSGKTATVRILHYVNRILYPQRKNILCAPTGRAARNLMEKAHYPAHTVHRVLGKTPDDDFLGDHPSLDNSLVVVDEASMLSLQLMAGLLNGMTGWHAHLVLVGDPKQLPAVGAGDVLNDLMTLGIPETHLTGNHRQETDSGALIDNIMEFNAPGCVTLCYDDNFRLEVAYTAQETRDKVVQAYEACAHDGAEVQVLSPFRAGTAAGVHALNLAIQAKMNPPGGGKFEAKIGSTTYRDGDRVMLTVNLDDHCNGDVGTLILRDDQYFGVQFDYSLGIFNLDMLKDFTLAYAITIHKAQGSEYDTVIVPVIREFGVMLNANLLYTAISRAKHKLILVGQEGAIEKALTAKPEKRNSSLVPRTKYMLGKRRRSCG